MLRTLPLALSAAAIAVTALAVPATAQTYSEQRRFDAAQRRFDNEQRLYDQERALFEQAQRRDQRRSSYNDPRYPNSSYSDPYNDPRYQTDYDASRYYKDDPRYQERTLTSNDQVYRGSDGRYYCKRNDGTTGLIVGAAAGGILGNVVDGGRNRIGGTLIGGALGALLGKKVDQSNTDYRCR
ncbi:glycine zipper 2TM domain-containing protein [Sphingomonas panacisoli]|uniref:17 kDa surface antigen n=1 Tax=Sphingomonas panacisoli TaxID=1813879 RepID=A0A5B8LHG0_9SPHN|nr:glycine zipper 2TM domain-containing protein [Sphingomonas panacisoli]QDZ07064.1 glycine zipper 2TM domain-containing protein [Sphingomonas panacisoli]